jgi:hypothetical protein
MRLAVDDAGTHCVPLAAVPMVAFSSIGPCRLTRKSSVALAGAFCGEGARQCVVLRAVRLIQ